jgi:2-methylcitrate dehydratase PrpD
MNIAEHGIYLDRLIDNILNTKFEDIPFESIDHAKNRLLDVVGCMVCGANDVGNPELLGVVRDWGGKSEARIFVHGDRLPAPIAAMVNCIMARSFDFEPVSPVVDGQQMAGHISGTTTMIALTLGDMRNVNGKELLASLLVGDDMATRVLLAGKGGTRRGFDHVGQANSFGATAIAGRLMRLSHQELKHAFGLILDHLGGAQRMISDTAAGFKLSQGNSARDAIYCVRLAQAGWTGADDALLSEGGYYSLFTEGAQDPDLLIKDLGKKYYSDGTFKPYPCCRMNHAAVDCAVDIIKEQHISADEIKEVILHMSPGALRDIVGQPFRIKNSPHASAGFSVQYNVANVLVRGSSRPEHFTEQAIRDPAIAEFLKKLSMAELREGNRESSRVKVTMKDGRDFDRFVEVAKGDPRNPLSREDLIAKFWTNIEFSKTIPRENAEKVLKLIDHLESLDNVRNLVDFLIA